MIQNFKRRHYQKFFCKKINTIWETLGTDDFSLRKDKSSKKFRRSIYVEEKYKKK